MVLTLGMSMPFSMIVVASSTSYSRVDERVHAPLQLALVHLPVADDHAQAGHELARRYSFIA